MKGKLIVIEGLDGSGKATQSEKLCTALAEHGVNVRKVSFPNYDSLSSALVKMYLGGEFGTDPDSVNPYAASSFYACDRFAGYKSDWGEFYENGGVIVADRYTTSNAIHQCSKLPKEKWDGFIKWLFDYEYRLMGIPEPDCVVYLRMETEASQKLMSGRYNNDESKKDIHEKNVGYLNNSRIAADYCSDVLGWKIVECSSDGTVRPVEEIGGDVFNIVKDIVL